MSRQYVTTTLAPQPAGPYSQAIASNGFLYTAGQTPHHPDTGDVVVSTIYDQTVQAMTNLGEVLRAHDLDFSHVIKATVHLQHRDRDFVGCNEAYETFFTAPYPARTTVGSHLGDFLIEIDVVAEIP